MYKIDYEKQMALIEDDTNVSKQSTLEEFRKVFLQFVVFIISAYIVLYFGIGLFFNLMSKETQIKLENLLTNLYSCKTIELPKKEQDIILKIKNNILLNDNKFPKTSKLDILIIDYDIKNAFCLPNGKIYITNLLYNDVKTNEQALAFIIAHEMAHYRHKDHFMALRKIIVNNIIAILIAVGTGNKSITDSVSAIFDVSDLSHSRTAELKCDRYASRKLYEIYGTNEGGIQALEIISQNKKEAFELLATHPLTKRRIKILKSQNF